MLSLNTVRPAASASEVTTVWRYVNKHIIIIIIIMLCRVTTNRIHDARKINLLFSIPLIMDINTKQFVNVFSIDIAYTRCLY